jgi:hypothetical protein
MVVDHGAKRANLRHTRPPTKRVECRCIVSATTTFCQHIEEKHGGILRKDVPQQGADGDTSETDSNSDTSSESDSDVEYIGVVKAAPSEMMCQRG